MISNIDSNYKSICKLFNFSDRKNIENQLIENFFNHKKYADNTCRIYNKVLRVFFSWSKDKEINEIIEKDVVDFVTYIRFSKKLSIRTCNLNITCIKAFFEYLFDQKSVESNPCKKIKQLKIVKNKTKKIDIKQIIDILEKIELKKDFRAKAIFSLLLFTKIKHNELLTIKTTDVKAFSNNFVKKSLEDYILVRKNKKTNLLFTGERGPMTDKGLRLVCLKYGTNSRTLKATAKNWSEDDILFILESLSKKSLESKQKKSIINSLDNLTKECISVTEMAKNIGLSRQRFGQLVISKIFPSPDYDPITNRPFYNLEKQKKCFLIKNTNIGSNGESILFYKKRSDAGKKRYYTGSKKNKHKQVCDLNLNNEDWIEWV